MHYLDCNDAYNQVDYGIIFFQLFHFVLKTSLDGWLCAGASNWSEPLGLINIYYSVTVGLSDFPNSKVVCNFFSRLLFLSNYEGSQLCFYEDHYKRDVTEVSWVIRWCKDMSFMVRVILHDLVFPALMTLYGGIVKLQIKTNDCIVTLGWSSLFFWTALNNL